VKNSSLNHVYRLVWSEAANAYIAVAEGTRGRGKRNRGAGALLAAALLGGTGLAQAQSAPLPTGGSIAAGRGSIVEKGSAMTVTQGSDRLVVNWNSFDIGAQSSVNFVQPGSGSIALNRVTGGSPSTILGSLSGNGQVWLVNPGGVVFGRTAQVDVGGLVASSLAMSDGDFLAGRNRFTAGAGAGAVVNQGRISATGGVVALVGPQVRNQGSITTPGGATVLAAGDAVSLAFNADGLVGVKIERAVIDALAENTGRISADGGIVVLSARGASKALDSVVNNTGVIEARSLVGRDGRILLDGDVQQGSTHVSGTLDVSSAAGQGGTITVAGHDIALDHGATLDAGGATGGGSIRVGGGFQGKDASVANAAGVSADATVSARADATGNGKGGDIVFWSDDATRFAGQLSVRGGAQGGDGGSIEVSGKQSLSYSGRADARAPLGRTGSLLLDPATLAISGGGTGSGAMTGSVVYEKDLEAQNANVLLQAVGNVTVNNLNLNGGDGTISMANNVSLRVEAGTTGNGSITFANAANTIETFGTGSLMFVAGQLGSGTINNVPNLIAHGTGTNPGTLPTHTVTSVGSGTPGDASITLFGADGVTVGGSVTTHGGYVRVWADSDDAGGGGYTMSAPVVTNGGNFYVSAGSGAILLNSNMTLDTGRILFRADGTWTNGTRTLGGVLSASGAINVDSPFIMNAGAGIYTDGVITLSNTVNLNTGAGSLTLRASAIDFTAATLSNLSTASMILQPADIATSMVLGDASGFASATTLAKLPGVKNLTIGRADGTGTTSVASSFSFAANTMLEVVNQTIDITGGTLTNTAGNITLTGNNVNISQAITANAGAGAVTIRQLTPANTITLGSGLTNAAIGQINAATLVIGRSDGGNVTFDSDISTGASTVHLLSGGQVIGTAGGVSAANLAVNAGGGATLTSPTFDFTTLALAVGGNTTINQSHTGYNVGPVDGVAGLAINAGTNANVTLGSAGIIGVTGALALNANTSTVTMNATGVSLSPTTVGGISNASFAFRPLNAGDNVNIGLGGDFISAASLNKLADSKNVTVGRSDGTGTATVQADVSIGVSGTLEIVDGSVALVSGAVANTGGALKLNARTGDITIDHNATASGQLTLATGGAGSVSGSAAVIAPTLLIDATGSSVALTSSNNNVGTIAGNAASLNFAKTTGLVVGTVGGVAGLHTTGSLLLRTTGATADLTLNQAVSGGSVVLASGRNFINNAGASAITASGGGRWLVYSGSPLNDSRGAPPYDFKQYNVGYGGSVPGSGNGFVYRVAPVVTIGLTGSTSKVYDALTTATLGGGNYSTSGTIDGDTVAVTSTGATYATKDVGSAKSVTASGLALTGAGTGGVAVYGYQLANVAATGNIGQITPATLTVGAATVADKVYDTTTGATVTRIALGGVLGSDAIGTTAIGAFADKNAGSAKTVTVGGIALTGADAGNYVLDTVATTGAASITPAALTVAGVTVSGKVYDATTAATVSSIGLNGVMGSDVIGTTATGTFANKNVGTDKAVAVTGITLTGADAGNYVLEGNSTAGSANITPAALTVAGATIANKVYDTGTAATVSRVAFSGVLGDDVIGASANASFADKNVGTAKAVAVTGIALTGAVAGNYVLEGNSTSGSADVTPAAVTVTGVTIVSKVYDANTAATVSHVALGGVIGGDVIGAAAVGTFDDKNVGTGKAVAVSGVVLNGADAANYVLQGHAAPGSATITPATLTVTGATVSGKVYDATTVATVGAVSLNGVFAGDRVGGNASGAFADPTVGNDKPVAVSGITLTGTDAGNYALAQTATTGQASIVSAGAGDRLAALTSPQIGSNATATAGGNGNGVQAPVGDLVSAHRDDAAAGATVPAGTFIQPQAGLSMAGSSATPGASPARIETVRLPDTALSSGGQFSIALGGVDRSDAVAAAISVYRAAPGSPMRSEGEFVATDGGSSLSLARVDRANTTAPALVSSEVRRSAQADMPVSGTESVAMRVDLMSDATLMVSMPASAASQSAESLAAYALVVAKKGLSVSVDTVRAIVLQFGIRAGQ
jgi:filamentous hemagglutinin family protein